MVAEGLDNAEPSRMIDMCSCATNTEGVVRWFEAMTEAGCKPTEVTFTSAIKAYGYKKNVRAAEFWFEAMRMCGFSPNEKAYSSIINAYARAKDVNGAEMWFRKMREAGLTPDHVAYNIMINAYTTVKDLGGAERWFDEMRSAGFGRSQPLYASMSVAYATARRVPFAKVKALVEDMRAHGLTPDYDTLSSLLKSCSRASPPQAAVAAQWFQEFIPETWLSPNIEKTTLPMAVGLEVAQQLSIWARHTHPDCATAPNGNRAGDGQGAPFDEGGADDDGSGVDGQGIDGSAVAGVYGFVNSGQVMPNGDPWGAPQNAGGWQDRPPLYARMPAPSDGRFQGPMQAQQQMPMMQMQGGTQYAMQQQSMQFQQQPGMMQMPLDGGANGGQFQAQMQFQQGGMMPMPNQMQQQQMHFPKMNGQPMMMQPTGVQFNPQMAQGGIPQQQMQPGPNGEMVQDRGGQVPHGPAGMMAQMQMGPQPGMVNMNVEGIPMGMPQGTFQGQMQPMQMSQPMQHYAQSIEGGAPQQYMQQPDGGAWTGAPQGQGPNGY